MRMLDHADKIDAHATEVRLSLEEKLRDPDFYELVSGRANTREATIERAADIESLIERAIGVTNNPGQ